MEIEASLPPPKVRFNKICKNYALRILKMHENHPIRLRVSSSFPPFSNKIELDWTQFLDWNKIEDNSNHILVNFNSELPSESIRRRKKRKINKKKQVSQLFKIITSIAKLLPSLKIEEISHKSETSWKTSLNSLIDITISELSKEKEAI